ncbi:MAG: ECF transporter S component [Clostridia bacterium]|nr:ECF transporter S component [Clostridia bacterium]
MTHKSKRSIAWLTTTALLMGMTVVMCAVSIPVPGGHLYLCDAIIVTAAILLDPVAAFLVGGVGTFLGDLLFYPAPMFVSLVSHGLQAILISIFAHYVLKKHPMLSAGIGALLGGAVMVVGYTLGRIFVYAAPDLTREAAVEISILKLPFEILQAFVGSAVGLLLCGKGGLRRLYGKMQQRMRTQ